MEISALQAFICVARHESFSKASEQMHLTQPAVSKRVATLEQQLGTLLFNRINRQISLTEAGQQLLPKAQELVIQAEDMQRFASNLHEDISGTLSIAISHHIGLHRMPPMLSAFNRRHPDVKLDIRFEDSEQALSLVERGDIEFAVITLPSELPANLNGEVAWCDKLQIVFGAGHGLQSRQSVSLAELADYPCVLPTAETETHKIMQREFARAGLSMKVQMSTNNLQSLKMLAVAGIGWSLLPETMLDDQLRVLDLQRKLTRDLGLVAHRRRSLSNAAQAMRQLIKAAPQPPNSAIQN
ncbi:MAG: LysR family transcriptional regulator [Gammaproteobacteria bacterium]|nr:LysR family transcriptional regulator [Gammaproteobacteria bacterium]